MALRTARRALARWLHRWAESILPDEDREGAPAVSPAAEAEEPELFLHGGGGPPAHWIELVRHAAPELLLPAGEAPAESSSEVEEHEEVPKVEAREERPLRRPARAAPPAAPVPKSAPRAVSPGTAGVSPAAEAPPPPSRQDAGSPRKKQPEHAPEAPRGRKAGKDQKDIKDSKDIKEAKKNQEAPARLSLKSSRSLRSFGSFPAAKPSVEPAPGLPSSDGRGLPLPRSGGGQGRGPSVPPRSERPLRGEGKKDQRPAVATPPAIVKKPPSAFDKAPPSSIDKAPPSRAAETAPPEPSPVLSTRIETAPAARPVRRRDHLRWPSLPEPPRDEPDDPAAERASVRSWERQQRLDREQQGV